MISWKQYVSNSPLLDRVCYLVTDGDSITIKAYVDGKLVSTEEYDEVYNVTHYSELNLP